MNSAPIAPGQLLAGRFVIRERLGGADLGDVYVARDQHGDRECAIKVLLPGILDLAAAWTAFQETARNVSSLSADAIARVSDLGLDANLKRPFFVSECVGFPSVANLVRARGPVELSAWVTALETWARSLDAAARIGIAHGDLKPQNLFLSAEHPSWGRVTDFGAASLRRALSLPSGLVAVGWSSPEELDGAAASPRGDVFALGLVTFYALTARHYLRALWQGAPDARLVREELRAPHAPASMHAEQLGGTLPRPLDEWFARALQDNPEARFASVLEAAAELRRVAAGAGLTPAPPAAAPVPGVAAAIAAPLLFQTLPQPEAQALQPTTEALPLTADPSTIGIPITAPPLPPVSVGSAEAVRAQPARGAAAATRPSLKPLAATGAALSVFVALAAYAAWHALSRETEPSSAPAAVPSTSGPASATARLEPVVPAVTRTLARFECVPEACEWIVCDGRTLPKAATEAEVSPGRHECTASRYGFKSSRFEFTAEAGRSVPVRIELSAIAQKAIPVVPTAAPSPGPVKPSAAPKGGKKKCGTFINPCK